MDSARHVIGWRLTQETRVQHALDGMSSTIHQSLRAGVGRCPRPRGKGGNRPISVYRLCEMPIQSCGQGVSAPRGKAGARLNAHTELRAKRQRSAREAIYRNRPVEKHALNVASTRPTLNVPSSSACLYGHSQCCQVIIACSTMSPPTKWPQIGELVCAHARGRGAKANLGFMDALDRFMRPCSTPIRYRSRACSQ
jgi:hypothetical protein